MRSELHPVCTTIRVALVGNPNSGKTTLFNALTGLHQKVGNYPGVTVERKEGRISSGGRMQADLIDLPGTYSLHAGSPDEQLATDVLLGKPLRMRRNLLRFSACKGRLPSRSRRRQMIGRSRLASACA